MHYPTHSLAYLVCVTGERITNVSCLGWAGQKLPAKLQEGEDLLQRSHVDASLAMSIPGIGAHHSALKGREQLDVPNIG